MTDSTTTLEAIDAKLDRLLAQEVRPWPPHLSIKLAAEYSSLSEESIRRLLSSGKLTAHRVLRGRVTIGRQQLDDLITTSVSTPRHGRGGRR